jgi:hypothetical protein
VLDHERVKKRGFAALRDACRPVLPMIEPREGLVHVVSERRDALAGASIEVTGGGRHLGCFAGDVDADAVTYVGRVELDGVAEASVALEHPALGRIENRYRPLLLESVRREARG